MRLQAGEERGELVGHRRAVAAGYDLDNLRGRGHFAGMDFQIILFLALAAVLWPIPPAIAYSKGRPIGFVILGTIIFYPAALVGAIVMERNEKALAARRASRVT